MQKILLKSFILIDNINYSELSIYNKNTNIIYRNYKKNISKKDVLSLKKFCKKRKFKFYLSNNLKLALKYKLDGLYIPSFNNNLNYKNLSVPKGFRFIGSAHNKIEVQIKKKQGCTLIFLSPIFKTLKNEYYLNINKFNLITNSFKQNFVALGGIKEENLKLLNLLNIKGFAGISFFQKKTAHK